MTRMLFTTRQMTQFTACVGKFSQRRAFHVISAGGKKTLAALLITSLFVSQCILPVSAAAWGEFTIKDEKELGEKFNILLKSRLPLVQDPEVVDYVVGIVKRLEKTMPPQPIPFTASVLQHNALNAFATPGGYLFVHTGLILAMDNESEVAGVIAHEMAHVTQRHIASRIENSQWISIFSVLGALAGAFLGGQAGPAAMTGSLAAGQAAMLNYSRNDEREADQVGMNFLTKAGYPPSGMSRAFKILSRKQWLMGGDIPSYLSTHPGLTDRVRDMEVRTGRLAAPDQTKKDDNIKFLRVQALVRARYSDPQPALQAFAKQVNGPQRCVALMGQGILASRQNRIADAITAFDNALACDKNDSLIIREAGRFHYTKGEKNKAISLLEQAVKMNRHDIMALYYYSRCLGDAGKTVQAIDMMKEVLRKEPEDAEVHETLAKFYGENGQLFSANLHMAYSGLYSHNKRKHEQFFDKAKKLARTPQEKTLVERFEDEDKKRKEIIK